MRGTLPVMTEDQEHQQTLMVDQGARLILGVTPMVVREGKAARMGTEVMVETVTVEVKEEMVAMLALQVEMVAKEEKEEILQAPVVMVATRPTVMAETEETVVQMVDRVATAETRQTEMVGAEVTEPAVRQVLGAVAAMEGMAMGLRKGQEMGVQAALVF